MKRESELRETGGYVEPPSFWYEIETYDRSRFLWQVKDAGEGLNYQERLELAGYYSQLIPAYKYYPYATTLKYIASLLKIK